MGSGSALDASAREKFSDVARHALVDSQEGLGVSRLAQRRHIGLGEILVLARELGWEGNIFDDPLALQVGEPRRRLSAVAAARVDHRDGYVVEALRGPGADIEYARPAGIV